MLAIRRQPVGAVTGDTVYGTGSIRRTRHDPRTVPAPAYRDVARPGASQVSEWIAWQSRVTDVDRHKIVLTAVDVPLAEAWRRWCGDLGCVEVHHGSIFDVASDAVV